MQTPILIPGFFSALLLLSSAPARAQQVAERPRENAMRSIAYNAAQETVVEGTVLNYTPEASPPIGAHLLLQTTSGTLDLHLGPASYLQANRFSLTKGDAVRVVGVNSAMRQGGVFLVRVIQKGEQSLTLRTSKGAPLSFAGARALGSQKASQPVDSQAGPR